MKFKDLNLIEPILRAVEEKGYTHPTPIQIQAIPLILDRHDVLGCAQTGTGKTAAFAIPIIQIIHNNEGNQPRPKLRSLILTPTRELAIQIEENIQAYARHTKLKHAVIFGGVKQNAQVSQLKRGVHILVATPGRLLDLIQQGFVSLNDVKLFVLDEADRMLDMGFINDIKKILKLLPVERQSLFFSATMPENIIELASSILVNPEKVEVSPVSSTAEKIVQELYYTNRTSKNDLLIHILKERNIEQALIFTRTKHGADRLAKRLKSENIPATAIHGNKSQVQRQNALAQFKNGKAEILVATDIAARGIDIEKLQCVINFEVSNEPEAYVHRIGRSGRAGEEGIAITLCEPEENEFVDAIEKLTKVKITVIDGHPYPQTDKPMTANEKKQWNKEKIQRKQEFHATKNNNRPSRIKKSERAPKDEAANSSVRSPKKVKTDHSQGQKSKTSQRPERSSIDNDTATKPFKRKTVMPNNLREKYRWPLEK